MNRCFYEVAVPLIYETLEVRFSDYNSLQHIVREIKENPRRRQSLIYARRLNIMAIPQDSGEEVFDLDSLTAYPMGFGPHQDLRARDLIPDTFGSPGFFFRRHLTEPSTHIVRYWRAPGFYTEKIGNLWYG